ncbi:MAG TPA: SDR family NAD(P)-dependent oxidoreductase [Candidatus Dormibacteraeota bacterium]|nr:SDR family NAD(P)-dependent oxidoreductase [Candidatus Dormibacteraeota bacterium]
MQQVLHDEVAIVTGAGSGIGKATALLLSQAGARIACFDRDEGTAHRTRSEIQARGGQATAIVGDVAEEAQVQAAVERAERELGPLRILVNAAGIVVRKNLLETSAEEWRRVIDVNLTGYFHFLRAAVPRMEAAGGGRIVQVASIAGHTGYGYVSYTATKGGVLAITRQLASELAPKRIRINSISPGVIETGLNRDTLADQVIREATVANTPWGRLGRPDDIAQAVLFLVSPASDFVTGTDLVVDGGMISGIQWGAARRSLHSFHATRS